MTFALLGRRALAPAGGVMTVASLSVAFSGERSLAQISQRAAGRFGEATARNMFQRQRFFSSKPSAPSAPKPPASEPKPTELSTPTKTSPSFVAWYEGHLESRPVITKMLTGSLLWGIGDAVAQLIPQLVASDDDKTTTANIKDNSQGEDTSLDYDITRTGRAVLFGFALHAPTSHVHFNLLEWMTQRVGVTGLGIPVFKTIMEQFVYWGWISNGMYLGAMGAMQGHSPEKIYNKIHESIWGLMQAQWTFWIPVQLLNFQFVPVRHQLNVVLVTSIVWTALLSFWYPPEPKIPTAPVIGDAAAKMDQS